MFTFAIGIFSSSYDTASEVYWNFYICINNCVHLVQLLHHIGNHLGDGLHSRPFFNFHFVKYLYSFFIRILPVILSYSISFSFSQEWLLAFLMRKRFWLSSRVYCLYFFKSILNRKVKVWKHLNFYLSTIISSIRGTRQRSYFPSTVVIWYFKCWICCYITKIISLVRYAWLFEMIMNFLLLFLVFLL